MTALNCPTLKAWGVHFKGNRALTALHVSVPLNNLELSQKWVEFQLISCDKSGNNLRSFYGGHN